MEPVEFPLLQMSLADYLNTSPTFSILSPAPHSQTLSHEDVVHVQTVTTDSCGIVHDKPRLRPARPSCLVRSLSTYSFSSASSVASNRSVRFSGEEPKVQYTYPKEVYDRASIRVDKNLALKRCGEEEPRKWVDCFIDHLTNSCDFPLEHNVESQDASIVGTSSDGINLAESFQSYTSSASGASDSDNAPSLGSEVSDTETNGTNSSYSTPATSPSSSFDAGLPSFASASPILVASTPFFGNDITASPTSYFHPNRLSASEIPACLVSSKSEPNFMRWDLPKPSWNELNTQQDAIVVKLQEKPQALLTSKDGDIEKAKERRRFMNDRLRRMRDTSKQHEDAFGCLGGF
ncbi:MAG: hypothetical protein CYPHOPRED_000769 [Cyphobasidiales sp. Tagirdzhanova-0007]|nr:MAG: hypothetical protein CYPHOPRED_000769 [Cyphobasidiales sp. Tagirdzhanova-0007]